MYFFFLQSAIFSQLQCYIIDFHFPTHVRSGRNWLFSFVDTRFVQQRIVLYLVFFEQYSLKLRIQHIRNCKCKKILNKIIKLEISVFKVSGSEGRSKVIMAQPTKNLDSCFLLKRPCCAKNTFFRVCLRYLIFLMLLLFIPAFL